MKPRFHHRLQLHGHHRLRDPVRDRRHAQHSDPTTMRLGDLHRPDRRREVGSRAHPIPDLVEVVLQIGLELVEILTVHSRRSLVGRDLPPRLPDHQLGNRKRLVLRALACCFASSQDSSAPVERIDIPDQPAPSLHPHPSEQELHHYYGPVRQRASRPVLNASGFRRRHAPSRRPSVLTRRPGRPVSTLAFSRSVPEPQTRLTPPSRRAPPGQSSGHPPGSSRGNNQTPRFRCHLNFSNDASTAHTHPRTPDRALSGTSSWSPPDASSRAFSGSLTTTVFSQRSIRWFDALPPKDDAGGPTSLHLQHSTASMKIAYINPPSTFVTHELGEVVGRHQSAATRSGPRSCLFGGID